MIAVAACVLSVLSSSQLQCFSIGEKSPRVPISVEGLDPMQYTVPWAGTSPCAKRQLDRVSHLSRAHGPWFLYFTMDRPLPHPKIAPFPDGGSRRPSNTWLLGPTRVHTQTKFRSVQPICHWHAATCYDYNLPTKFEVPASSDTEIRKR